MKHDTFNIGGDMPVQRLGFGAMRITGDGIWGWPPKRSDARDLLRRAVELGVDLLDTADAYGPEVSEYLICEALKPYKNIHIATKGGLVRAGPGDWRTDGRPEHLEIALHNSLRRLEVERIDLYQLHAIDDDVPLEDSLGALKKMQEAGKIRYIGVSNIDLDELKRARKIVDVVTVQNKYNLFHRDHEAVIDHCTENAIGFIPWAPLGIDTLADTPPSSTSPNATTPRLPSSPWPGSSNAHQ
ncbi:aldo/keto reductase family protein [Bradymonas sediminis]|nr:aldo/keto reductase [Bradymonas sediminis]TDP63607.1 aldo/keto reductase family protein [Bradymonas sediminis]